MAPAPTFAEILARMLPRLAHWPELLTAFEHSFPNALTTSVSFPTPETTFVITGDIQAMWLRDSTAQVWPYLHFLHQDAGLRRMFGGLIVQQARCITLDPYANAFNLEARGPGHPDQPPSHPLVWERKFELDSLCYPIRLAHAYWRAGGDTAYLTGEFRSAASLILKTLRCEQQHASHSLYRFHRPLPVLPTDNLPNGGLGQPVGVTGMIWSAFRPSDDACTYNYNVPGNMMAAVELGHLAELASELWAAPDLAHDALTLKTQIEAGIEEYGVVEHPIHGPLYAYETDGLGHHLLMDDANVPSLLSIPYLGYRPASDQAYQNTRAFVLSPENPYYVHGTYAQGVGSPHTPAGFVWPIALAMQGLTSGSETEVDGLLEMLVRSAAGTHLMHESFDPDDPARFTREWFGWANSLFAELVLAHAGQPQPA